MKDELTRTLQNYLEAVFRIQCSKRVARVRDIASALGVHKSTVTAALGTLTEKGLVEHEPYGLITLTPEGRDQARRIAVRHLIIREFLEQVLDLEPALADTAACQMEYAVAREVLERLICFRAFLDSRPVPARAWVEEFHCFARDARDERRCEEWFEQYLQKVKQMEVEGFPAEVRAERA